MIATHLDGVPLAAGNGAPARLVAPGRRGFWWVKWVTAVEPSTRPPWWQSPFPLELIYPCRDGAGPSSKRPPRAPSTSVVERMGADVCIWSVSLAIDEIAADLGTDAAERERLRALLRTRFDLAV